MEPTEPPNVKIGTPGYRSPLLGFSQAQHQKFLVEVFFFPRWSVHQEFLWKILMIQFGMFFLKWMVFFSFKLVLLQPFIFSLKSQAPGKYMTGEANSFLADKNSGQF